MKKIAGYRTMLGKTQHEMANFLGISKQSYSLRERGIQNFKDAEKMALKELFASIDPTVTIDSLFF